MRKDTRICDATQRPDMGAPLLAMIQAWKLEDIQQLLIRHGVINLERLKEITPEDVTELGIPFAPAKVFF